MSLASRTDGPVTSSHAAGRNQRSANHHAYPALQQDLLPKSWRVWQTMPVCVGAVESTGIPQGIYADLGLAADDIAGGEPHIDSDNEPAAE